MVKKTRKQKEKAAQRREYLAKLVGAKPEIKEEIPQREISSEIKTPRVARIKETKVATSQYEVSDFRKSLLLSGLFIAILIVLVFLERKYGFLDPLASNLMEKLVK